MRARRKSLLGLLFAFVAVLSALPQAAGAADVDLLTDAHIKIQGAAADNRAGYSVSPAGDVNGDGRDDVIVGAYGTSDAGDSSGSAYVIYGATTADPADVDLASLGTHGFVITGASTFDFAGYSVGDAGDVNGDGHDDVIVGAIGADTSTPNAGAAYVVYGSAEPDPPDVNLGALGTRGFEIRGYQAGSEAANSVAGAGDVNGDGRDDVIVGTYRLNRTDGGTTLTQVGVAYVVYGSSEADPADVELNALGTRGFEIQGANARDEAGTSVAGGGDVNGDGRSDVIVGAPGFDKDASTFSSGAAYVIFGSTAPDPDDVSLAALGTRGFTIAGAADSDTAGYSVGDAGDVNGDGRDDVITGAPQADPNASSSGAAYVVYGSADATSVDLATPAARGMTIAGAADSDRAGTSVAGAGDVNGDGHADVIVGARDVDTPSRPNAGAAYVVYGSVAPDPADVSLLSLDPANGFRIVGATAESSAGMSVASARNFNGDGGDDVIVGAFSEDTAGGLRSGAAHIVLGPPAVAVADAITVSEDAATPIDPLANDGPGYRSIVSKTSPAHGTLDGLTYTPSANYCGSDSFSYTLVSGSQATVTLTVACVDDAPTAVDDTATVLEDAGPTLVDVTANDADIDGGPKVIESTSTPAHGGAATTLGGIAYKPDPDFCGTDSFTYKLSGGSTATVAVTVTCVDDPPAPAANKPRLSVKLASRFVNRRGALVRLRCSVARCRGKIALRSGKKSGRSVKFSIAAMKRKALRVPLPGVAQARLAKRGKARVTAVARPRGGKTVKRALTVYRR